MHIKKIARLFIVLTICSMLVACGGSGISVSKSKSYSDNSYNTESSSSNENYDDDNSEDLSRRQIKKYNLEADSKTFDETYAGVKALLPKYKAYVDNANFSNSNKKRVSTNMRVPSANVQSFIEDIKSVEGFNLLYESESTTDVENSYVDVEKRLTALNKRLEKLYELQEKEKNIDRILDIESKLQDTITSIEQLEGTKEGLDRDVAYSEVDLTLTEVYTGNRKNEPTEAPFGEELAGVMKSTGKAYRSLAKGLLFTIIYLLPTIVIFLILNKFVFKEKLIGKKFRKKTNLKNENKPIKNIDKPYEDTNKKE